MSKIEVLNTGINQSVQVKDGVTDAKFKVSDLKEVRKHIDEWGLYEGILVVMGNDKFVINYTKTDERDSDFEVLKSLI